MLDVQAIEHATLAAVPPRLAEECQGWLVALDPGTVGRAHSAAPLHHGAPSPGSVHAVEALYAREGLPPVFRLPAVPAFDGLRTQLAAAGYRGAKPTLVQLAAVHDAAPGTREVRIDAWPDAGWEEVFLGEGFDPVDGACRLALLRRSRDAVFARIVRNGRTVAVGAACFSQGWCGLHGMRTAPTARRGGCASAIVAALLREARSRGIAQAFLQVEQGNAAAQSVYRRFGFETAWGYDYWKRPAPGF